MVANLEQVFLNQLSDLYNAEKHATEIWHSISLKLQPTNNSLSAVFENLSLQSNTHLERIAEVYKLINKPMYKYQYSALEAITDPLVLFPNSTVDTNDAALIMMAQKMVHYIISCYEGLLQLAIALEKDDACKLLDTSLIEKEEGEAILFETAAEILLEY